MPRALASISAERTTRTTQPFRVIFSAISPMRPLKRIISGYSLPLMLIFAGSFGIGLTITPSLLPRSHSITTSHSAQSEAAEDTHSLSRSIPTHIDIPSVSVSADIVELGRNSDDTLSAPDDYTKVGWYRDSPTPGEIGPSIITGHVDNYLGPAVFFPLKEVRPSERISIVRADSSTATFVVDAVKIFDQNEFPTQQVYGNINHAGLRLITCGGIYNPLTNHYSHNVVVYASLLPEPVNEQIKNTNR